MALRQTRPHVTGSSTPRLADFDPDPKCWSVHFTIFLRPSWPRLDPDSSCCRVIVGVLSGDAGIFRCEIGGGDLNDNLQAWRRDDVAPETAVVVDAASTFEEPIARWRISDPTCRRGGGKFAS